MLKTQRGRDIAMYEYFFKSSYESVHFPNVFVPLVQKNVSKLGYDVELSILGHKGRQLETTLTKSEFRPQFGFNTRYTKYDIKDDENESDILGGIYFLYEGYSIKETLIFVVILGIYKRIKNPDSP